jgi:glycerol 3-phosphatase-2
VSRATVSRLLGTDRPLAEVYDVALVDLDGVAYLGPAPIPGAAEGLAGARARGMRLVFVTNNASREPSEVAEQLTKLSIPTSPEEVITAAQAAVGLLRTRLSPGARVLVVGGAGLRAEVVAAGYAIVASADDLPEAVVQGFAPDVGWLQLAEAAYAVQAGAWHVASNRDLTLPQDRGIAPGNGSLVNAVVAATGIEPDSAGKPAPTMFLLAAERVGAHAPLVVGDRLDSDHAAARAAGFPGLLVFTGVSSPRDAILAAPDERPSYLAADLTELLEAHPAPASTVDGWWTCRAGAARVVGGRLDTRGSHATVPERVDLVRAACAAVWAAVDSGAELDPGSIPDMTVEDGQGVGASR